MRADGDPGAEPAERGGGTGGHDDQPPAPGQPEGLTHHNQVCINNTSSVRLYVYKYVRMYLCIIPRF